jgi:hypothetical protein
MWEDFMRGNWPTAASTMPAPAQLPSVEARPTRSARAVQYGGPAHAVGYARAAAPAEVAHAQVTARPVAGKLAFRAALAAGAGLVLAVLVPGSAVAGSTHATGAHAHVAAHAATIP